MHIGVVLPQVGAEWRQIADAARHAEQVGADSVWVVDHVLGFPPDRGIMEAWTVMSALAAVTETVEIGAQVLCQSFRSPGLLAKMAATLDNISDGRLRMLVGAGWFAAEYEAFGWEFPSPGTRIEELRDAVRILRGLLDADAPFTYEGRHHRVKGAVNIPAPRRRPLPIEVGGAGDRLLRLIARDADGWNCPGAVLGRLDDRIAFLRRECDKADRSFDELRLSCQIVCAVGDDEAARHPAVAMFNAPLGLVGSVERAVERAGELMGKGMRDFNVVVAPGARGQACLERLVGEVRPQLKRD